MLRSSTEVDLDDLIPTAVEGSDTDSVADALERDVVVDADFVQRSVDEDRRPDQQLRRSPIQRNPPS